MKVYKDGNVYKVALLDGKYYAYSKVGRVKNSGGVLPDAPVIPDEPDVPDTTKTYNVNLVGLTMKNDNGILSGFDADNYAIVPVTIPDNFSSIEIVMHATFGGGGDYPYPSLFSTNGETEGGYSLNFAPDGRINTAGAWGNIQTSCYCPAGEEFWIKMGYDGTFQNLLKSTNGVDYEEYMHRNKADKYGTHGTIVLGKYLLTDTLGWSGTIDLNGCYIKVDDVVIWEGVTTS